MNINMACRLCLKMSNANYEITPAIARDILDNLHIKINLDISENAIICKKCMEDLKICLDFKSLCDDTENNIVNFLKSNNVSKTNMEEVYLNVGNNLNLGDIKKICRFCMKPSENVCLINKINEDEHFTDMLELFLPELSLNVTDDPISCIDCLKFVNIYFIFLKNCQETEQYVKLYCNTVSLTRQKVNFNDIADSFLNVKSECIYKIENTALDIKEEVDDETVWSEELLATNSVGFSNNMKYIKKSLRGEKMNILNKDEINKSKCSYVTKCKSTMKNHIKLHGPLTTYKCGNCSFESVRKDCLKNHIIRKHKDPSEVQMYKCASCSYETKIKSSLDRHIIRIHKTSSEVNIYKCANCRYEGKMKEDIRKHILNKHKDPSETKKYKCINCSYAAKSKDKLDEHVIHKHTDYSKLQMFKCDHCPYEAKTKRAFKRHFINQHMDPSQWKTYNCPNCPYQAKEKNKLNQHIIYKHTDSSELKMYKCTECSYQAKVKGDVKKHIINKHKDPNEAKTYKCGDCSYAAKRKSTLDNHIIYKHRDYSDLCTYKCAHCPYEAKLKENLVKHFKNKHKNFNEANKYA